MRRGLRNSGHATYDRWNVGDIVTDVMFALSRYDEDAIFVRTVEEMLTLCSLNFMLSTHIKRRSGSGITFYRS